MNPRVLDDPVITSIAQRVHKTPGQVALAWAVQRGAAFLTTSTTPRHIQENFEISALPAGRTRRLTFIRRNTTPGGMARELTASFDGGRLTSDGGVMLLAAAETG